MKAFFSAVLVVLALYMPVTATANELTDSIEFIHGLQVGYAKYSFHDCTPNCAGPDNFAGKVAGMTETLYWKTKYKLEPGVQVGFLRTTAMHIHDPGEINDQLMYALAIVRMPLTSKMTGYAGGGIGSQFTQIVLPNHQLAECNHGAYVAKVGMEYMMTKRVGVGLEYMYAKVPHKFGGEEHGSGDEEHGEMATEKVFLDQKMHTVLATVSFRF